MRYFRYAHTDRALRNALKAQYAALTNDEKRYFRKQKIWKRISMIVTALIFFSCMIIGHRLIKLIPQPDDLILAFLLRIAKVICCCILLIAAAAASYGLTIPLWKKAGSRQLPAMKKAILSEACAHLREYYGLQEPYIITKCYDATDKRFRDHDVCIFVSHGELRLTTDLVHGFLYGQRDLGCYAFDRDEIALSMVRDGNRMTAELKAGDAVFRLGYRAMGYIEHSFT